MVDRRNRDRLRFERRIERDDGTGNRTGEWIPVCDRWAELKPMRGGEDVLAARLESRQPVQVRIRLDVVTHTIDADCRAVHLRTGRVYALRTVEDMERRGRFLTILAETGVAP